MPVEHFRSKGAEMRNLAYRHIHGLPVTAKEICVGKKCHKVQRSKNKARRKIDAAQRKKVARKRG